MQVIFSKGWLAVAAVAGLLSWGSWQAPKPSQYARPAAYAVFAAPALRPGTPVAELQARIERLPGVTACAIRPANQLLTVAFNPDSTSQLQLSQRLGLSAQAPRLLAPAAPTARQCPVPTGYVLALEKVRFFFNLRRLSPAS